MWVADIPWTSHFCQHHSSLHYSSPALTECCRSWNTIPGDMRVAKHTWKLQKHAKGLHCNPKHLYFAAHSFKPFVNCHPTSAAHGQQEPKQQPAAHPTLTHCSWRQTQSSLLYKLEMCTVELPLPVSDFEVTTCTACMCTTVLPSTPGHVVHTASVARITTHCTARPGSCMRTT
jgi:hypothetical protein